MRLPWRLQNDNKVKKGAFSMKDKTCCFTGHRKIPPLAALGLKRKLEKTLKEKIEQGYLYFGAGGALGFDTLAAQTVIITLIKQ
jgi:hypothetical protein